MAARFYGSQPKTIVAVTGTSGKTSVAEFTRQIFAALGRKAASLGTIGIVKPDGAVYGSLTTPDPVTLHETLAGLAGEGVTHLAMEASSHGLDQYRLDGVRLSAGAFTNLGRDHLDYHPTIESYLAAKLRLFTELLEPGQPAVVNLDSDRAQDVANAARARGLRLVSVGARGETVKLAALSADGFAQRMSIVHEGRTYDIRLPLVGAYQVSNALVAAGLALAAGEPAASVIVALEALKGVKGRLDIVGTRNGGLAVVDYAHKPEALAAALDSIRPFARGKLICVFGCGGDRDRGKRPLMGRIAVEHADVTIVTDDNPRTEVPAAIRAEILAAAPGAREIGDRAEAIGAAVAMMGPGDVVLVAGKGHETGQIVGDTVIPFSDHEVLERALAKP
jgi:UDP-N-acetylmuramoyl-L-alanyl-D-glutamate--2,6-diaminopimelate ligase